MKIIKGRKRKSTRQRKRHLEENLEMNEKKMKEIFENIKDNERSISKKESFRQKRNFQKKKSKLNCHVN